MKGISSQVATNQVKFVSGPKENSHVKCLGYLVKRNTLTSSPFHPLCLLVVKILL